jgi:hypothetical protein
MKTLNEKVVVRVPDSISSPNHRHFSFDSPLLCKTKRRNKTMSWQILANLFLLDTK